MATADIAKLGFEVDSTPLKVAATEAQKLGKSVEETGTKMEKAGKASKASTGGIGEMSGAMKLLTEHSNMAGNSVFSLGEKLSKFANPLTAFVGALAAGVGMIAALGAKAIETADNLNDLTIGTGKTFEELQTLGVIADKSGSSLEGMLATLNVVAKGLSKTEDETSKYSKALAFFGVSAEDANGKLKSSEQIAYEVAKAYSEAEKSASTQAAAQIALGQSYEKQIPSLLALKDKQEELNKLREYGAVVDQNLATASDQYNDTLRDVKSVMQGVGNDAARVMLPMLQGIAEWFIRSATQGGVLQGVLGVLKGAFWVLVEGIKIFMAVLIQMDAAVQIAGRGIGALAAAIANPTQVGNIWKEFKADVAKINTDTNKALADLAKTIEKTGVAADSAGPKLKELGSFSVTKVKESKDVFEDYADAMAALEVEIKKQVAAQSGLTIETNHYDKALLQVEKDLRDGKIITNQAIDAYLATATALDKATKAAKEYAKAQKENADEAAELRAAFEAIDKVNKKRVDDEKALVASSMEQTQQIKDEIGAIGMSTSQLIDYNAQLERTRILKSGVTDETKALLLAQVDERQRLEHLKDATQQYSDSLVTMRDSIQSNLSDFFLDLLNNGNKAFKNLWQNFKNWALQAIADIAAKKITMSIVGSLAGGAAGGASAGGLGGGGADGIMDLFSQLGGSFSNLTSIFTTGTSMMTTAATSFATSAAGAALGLSELAAGSAVVEAGSIAAGSVLTSAGAGLVSMVPVVGWIAAAAGIAYAIFNKPGGGPKSGGFATSGATPGIGGTDDSGARWFTPNQSDKDVQKMVDAMQKNYNNLLKAFGGTGSATFALGFDTDPQGKAPNRLHAGAFNSGGQTYDAAHGDLGRDEKELQAMMELESKRAVLAALQASDLPEYLANILDSVDVKEASGEAIDKILMMAGAIKGMVDAFEPMGGVFEKFATSLTKMSVEDINGLAEAFGGVEKMAQSMSFIAANFTTGDDKMKLAKEALNDAFTQAGAETIPKTHEEFIKLLDTFDLTTEEGRNMYASISALAPAFVNVYGTADQAAAALQKVKDELKGFETDSFLTDDDKKAAAGIKFTDDAKKYGVDPAALSKSHKEFQAWVHTLGLTDAQILELEKDFVAFNGTAQQAADQAKQDAKDLEDKAKAAEKAKEALQGFLDANFLTEADRHKKAQEELTKSFAALGQEVPKTHEEFLRLLPTLGLTTEEAQALAEEFINVNGTLDQVTQSAKDAAKAQEELAKAQEAAAYAASQTAASMVTTQFQAIMAAINEIANGSGKDFGEKLAIQLKLIPEQMARLQAEILDLEGKGKRGSPEWTALMQLYNQLSLTNNAIANQLARYTILAAQYDDKRAEELVKLQDWYEQMKATLAGQPEALAALQVLFDKKWKEIIDGTGTGVEGTLEQLEKLRQGIKDYLYSLRQSDLSPDSPMTKLATAKKKYEEQLKLAQSGDVNALGNITKYADDYLKLAKQVYASSPAYNAIFDLIYGQLELLAEPLKGIQTPATTNMLGSAAPVGSPISSQDDIKELKKVVADAMAELIDLQKSGKPTEKVVEKLESLVTTETVKR